MYLIMFQYPDTYGNISIPKETIDLAKENNILTSCATDLMALTKLICPVTSKDISLEIPSVLEFRVVWWSSPYILSADQN